MRSSFRELRRSLKGEKDGRHGVRQADKTDIMCLPPKKVVRAMYDYKAQTASELSFKKGDFFHVIAFEEDSEWYEVCNPSTMSRGLVPAPFFQVLGKSERCSSEGKPARSSEESESERLERHRQKNSTAKDTPLYGILQYDFKAERPDELDAKAGEAIIVIAQSNHEWFVAKPIGRLGGPGLIPISFIELRDMVTGAVVQNVEEYIAQASIPKVEEWKRVTNEYKANSIPLGKFETDYEAENVSMMGRLSLSKNGARPLTNGSAYSQADSLHSFHRKRSSLMGGPKIVKCQVESYGFNEGRYWYLVRAEKSNDRHLSLARFYEDFYDLQITLLDEFPIEAGRDGHDRIIPFMPGPLTHVTDSISAQRRVNLDEYIKSLIHLPPHISQSSLVKQFFTPREGDIEAGYNSNAIPQISCRQTNQRPKHRSDLSSLNGSPTQPRRTSNADIRQLSQHSPSISLKYSARMRQSSTASNASHMMRNVSSMTNESNSSATSIPSLMKIKVFYQDDLIAIRAPRDIDYVQLQSKIHERLGTQNVTLQYKNEASGAFADINGDQDLREALLLHSKLVIYAR